MGKTASKNKYVDLFDAASHGDVEGVKHFLEEKHVPVDTLNDHHQSAAHATVLNGHLNVLQYLLNKNPFLALVEDDKDETVFHIALKRGFLDIVDFLALHFKSDLLGRSVQGRTWLQLAAQHGHLHIVRYLIDHHDADVLETASNSTGDTVLHTAAKYGQLHIVGYLLEEKNVNVDLLNGRGQPPVFSATIGNHSNIVRYLVAEHCATVTIIDAYGNTILHHAFANGNLAVPRYLLDERQISIDVNVSNELGETLVSLAIEQCNLKLLQYIVDEKKAHLNVADRYGEYPLHKAVKTNNLQIVQYLVARGARPAAKNFHGKTPFQVAKLFNKYLRYGLHNHVLEYLELITPRQRRRRNFAWSSAATVHSPTLVAYPHSARTASSEATQLRDGGGVTEYVSKPHLRQFTRLDHFFVLCVVNQCIRCIRASHNQRARNDHLSSPTEIVERRIDQLAISSLEAKFGRHY